VNTSSILTCASVGLVGALLFAKGRRPLLKIQRGITLLRASGYLLEEMAEGAKSRLGRWPECKARAEREL
jgi:hypothetical protein